MADRRVLDLGSAPRGHDAIRITRETDHGRTMIVLREWFPDDSTGQMRPGRQAVAVRLGELDGLIASLQAARLKLTGGGSL